MVSARSRISASAEGKDHKGFSRKGSECGATVPFVAEPLHIHFAYGQRGFFKGSVFLQNTAVFGKDMML